MQSPTAVGKPLNRVDGRAKVTGAARYSTEAPVKGIVHALLVQSTLGRGRIISIDASSAMKVPGVIAVMTHLDKPAIVKPKADFMNGGLFAENRLPLADDVIHHAGQSIAVVIADSLETARYAASMLRSECVPEQPILSVDDPRAKAVEPPEFFGEPLQDKRGDVDAAIKAAGTNMIDATYTTPIENHNPMEPSNTTAVWDGDRLTVYDSTQWVTGTRAVLADAFNLPRENVRCICPYVGGGFGCKGFIWPHTLLAAMAAKHVNRPVRLVLTRPQTFTSCGYRSHTTQQITLATDADGKLTAMRHVATTATSFTGEFIEPCAIGTTRVTYATPNMELKHRLVQLNVPMPTAMRAPGETPGSFALESAMDELAYKIKVDPLQLRLMNISKEKHPSTGLPWSSHYLEDCYKQAAEKFGWSRRLAFPKSLNVKDFMIGQGMATAMYPANKFGGVVRIRLTSDGRAIVSTAAHDLGTGAYTVFTQMAADALGLAPENVKVELGDSTLPPGPIAGGSNSTATVSQAITNAADALRKSLGAGEKDSLVDLVVKSGKPFAEAEAPAFPGEEMSKHAFQSFGVHFIEVAIDPNLPRVQVRRVVSMFDCGRIINPKTARSQLMGGIVMGIGAALMEQSHIDERSGRNMTSNLADYAVPVNADIGSIEVMWTDKPDPYFNALGVRGIGEIGITGVAAAVANAVYHATGKRMRDLPITPDKLL